MNPDQNLQVERVAPNALQGIPSPASALRVTRSTPALVSPKLPRVGGFTLIEVLVALVIFAGSGLVLASSYVNVLSAHQAALQRDVNAGYLRLIRAAVLAEPTLTKVTDWNELTLPDDYTARWRATLTPTPVADLFDVSVEIELTGKDGNRQNLTDTCRLLRPTWSQPTDRETLRAAARTKLAQRTFQ